MHNGTVKFFNNDKGYGFIKDSASGEEYFVHHSGLMNNIKEGDSVSFDVQQGKKGPNAVNVKIA